MRKNKLSASSAPRECHLPRGYVGTIGLSERNGNTALQGILYPLRVSLARGNRRCAPIVSRGDYYAHGGTILFSSRQAPPSEAGKGGGNVPRPCSSQLAVRKQKKGRTNAI